ncbi:MAG: hypothetical protein KF745_10140 [Phycisphaeraceae bacterium]|nr:hypothetical protein [Phycisphaeraceae bacterium]
MRRLSRASALSLMLALCPAVGAQVEIRGEPAARRAVVEQVGVEGVLIRPEGMSAAGVPVLAGWDRVRSVSGAMSTAAVPFLPIADAAFRARTRLERGDIPAAAPLFEQLYLAYQAGKGPTAAVVAEGTLRCRLSKGETAEAVWPWLSWIDARKPAADELRADWIGGTLDRAALADDGTDLVPALAPIFLPDERTAALRDDPRWSRFESGDRVVTALAMLYQAAATEAMKGSPVSVAPAIRAAGEHAGVRFVAEIVKAVSADAGERREARVLLTERMNGVWLGADVRPARAAWIEAWCRAGIGRSLLKEPDIDDRRRGVIELLHVPARFGDIQPRLAAVALALAAEEMHLSGDDTAAASIVFELRGRFPRDPAAGWEGLAAIPQPTEGRPPR